MLIFCGGSGLRHFWKELFDVHVQRTTLTCAHPPLRLVVVVAMSDDGGSSRAIIDCIGGLPVGDCRNVGLAVVDAMVQSLVTVGRIDAKVASEVRYMHGLLTHRLCADDAEKARTECLQGTVARFRELSTANNDERLSTTAAGGADSVEQDSTPTWSLRSAAQSAQRALSTFLDAVAAPTTGSRSSQPFSFRNASIGNLVLAGMVLSNVRARRPAPTHGALQQFLNELLNCGYLCEALQFDVEVVPTLDYYAPSSTDVELPLPRVALEVVWADGTVTWGQRAVSYGAVGVSDPLVTSKERVSHLTTHHSGSRGAPTALCIWQEERRTSDSCVVASPIVHGELQRQGARGGQTRCMLARGSLLSSTLAAAVPHLGTVEFSIGKDGWRRIDVRCPSLAVPACLMVNGSPDTESLPFLTFHPNTSETRTTTLHVVKMLSSIKVILPHCILVTVWIPSSAHQPADSAPAAMRWDTTALPAVDILWLGSGSDPYTFCDAKAGLQLHLQLQPLA